MLLGLSGPAGDRPAGPALVRLPWRVHTRHAGALAGRVLAEPAPPGA